MNRCTSGLYTRAHRHDCAYIRHCTTYTYTLMPRFVLMLYLIVTISISIRFFSASLHLKRNGVERCSWLSFDVEKVDARVCNTDTEEQCALSSEASCYSESE